MKKYVFQPRDKSETFSNHLIISILASKIPFIRTSIPIMYNLTWGIHCFCYIFKLQQEQVLVKDCANVSFEPRGLKKLLHNIYFPRRFLHYCSNLLVSGHFPSIHSWKKNIKDNSLLFLLSVIVSASVSYNLTIK